MAISKADSEKMQKLAKEGKKIVDIWKQYFPKLSYWDVSIEVYGAGGRGAMGVKRMITNRINAIVASTSKNDRKEIATELQELVWHLYNNHKSNHEKLSAIRKALGE
jgi:hypothetical protein